MSSFEEQILRELKLLKQAGGGAPNDQGQATGLKAPDISKESKAASELGVKRSNKLTHIHNCTNKVCSAGYYVDSFGQRYPNNDQGQSDGKEIE